MSKCAGIRCTNGALSRPGSILVRLVVSLLVADVQVD